MDSAYQLLKYAKYRSTVSLTIKPIRLTELAFAGYGDCSWANAPGGRTHIGKVVLATDNSAFAGRAPASIVDWRSTRAKRVVRSTLAAEAIACGAACDHTCDMAVFFEEGLRRRRATDGKPRAPCVVATDCRSLWDVVQKVQPTCEEKRALIDIPSVKEHVGDKGIHWTQTHEQATDPLTKIDTTLSQRCTNFMMDSSAEVQSSSSSQG